MTYEECVAQVERVARLGRMACQSCGYEHRCRTKGCAILRKALAIMGQLYKDCYGLCDCCAHGGVPCDKPPCDGCLDTRRSFQPSRWRWRGVAEAQNLPSPGADHEAE